MSDSGTDGGSCPDDGINAKLLATYKSQFMLIRRTARAHLYGRARENDPAADHMACTTYVSYALRFSGLNIPVYQTTDGLRDALLKRGWRKTSNPQEMVGGSVMVAQDRAGWAGHPDHMYTLSRFTDRAGFGYIFDNQFGSLNGVRIEGFSHERNITVEDGNPPLSNSGERVKRTQLNFALIADCPKDAGPASDAGTVPPGLCAGKADGLYCTGTFGYDAVFCKAGLANGTIQCGSGTYCVGPNGPTQATKPVCDPTPPVCP